ncbi:MAG: TlyA family RNA methyltransferase [Defluviitaleaceae bacterium]|nr:TlyA family RNA methyltransferase [Defluviitaleaceae bacterium]
MDEKIRLDLIMMRRTGYSREFVRELIEKSVPSVLVGGEPVTKPGAKFPPDVEIVFDVPGEIYVSRGGYKLAYALKHFGIDLNGRTCLDAGASTGGFTDCMLQNGAAKVYAVDVGTAQLNERLRRDPRVVVMENTDIRDVVPEMLDPIDFLAADLSFISLSKVLPQMVGMFSEGILLIKPQFEAGRGHLSKHGVVKDKKTRARVIDDIYKCCADNGLRAVGYVESPITGHAGNVEYLLKVASPI